MIFSHVKVAKENEGNQKDELREMERDDPPSKMNKIKCKKRVKEVFLGQKSNLLDN